MPHSNPISMKVDDFDVDGAVRESFEHLPEHTRSGFLGWTVAAGGAALGAVATWPAWSASWPTKWGPTCSCRGSIS